MHVYSLICDLTNIESRVIAALSQVAASEASNLFCFTFMLKIYQPASILSCAAFFFIDLIFQRSDSSLFHGDSPLEISDPLEHSLH